MFFLVPNRSGPCGAQRCAICRYIMEAEKFSDTTGKTYNVRNEVTCKSTNVVYAVKILRTLQDLRIRKGNGRYPVPTTSP
ncbi:hypothetical protein DPMN_127598 [Dreissena polymorpha]|uniref:Uncharacterized protein n=1 Tax=Dreissena polymorpha TaxID=45954 RepID=A0A9D4GZI6_DREPO|nr:hypothetical protein DPMN_127598 [Dreissena polymorpha]